MEELSPVPSSPSPAEVREELGKILGSAVLRSSGRSSQLLTFLVDHTLCGKGSELKEYTIGVEAFGKGRNYDPHTDSLVRVQVRRLRAKLLQYYETEGLEDRIIIEILPGSYVPLFRLRHSESVTVQHKLEFAFGQEPRAGRWKARAFLALAAIFTVLSGAYFFFGGSKASGVLRTFASSNAEFPPNDPNLPAELSGATTLRSPISSAEVAATRYPNSAKIWATLANAYLVEAYLGGDPQGALGRKALESATLATRLDPNLAEAAAALGAISLFYEWDLKAADVFFRRSLALTPECEICLAWAALAHTAENRPEESIRTAGNAENLVPHSSFAATVLASSYYYAGRHLEAEREANYAMDLDKSNKHALAVLTASISAKGQSVRTRSAFSPRDAQQGAGDMIARFAFAYVTNGQPKLAEQLMIPYTQRADRGDAPYEGLAWLETGLGNRGAALGWLKKALQRREPNLIFIGVEPVYSSLRDDPEFLKIRNAVLGNRSGK